MDLGRQEVYIRKDEDSDWQRVGYVATSLSPVIGDVAEGFKRYSTLSVTLKCSVKIFCRTLLDMMKYKKPRTTYRTIRRNCAKRNRNR